MGVLSCSRLDCDNIMCSYSSDEFGYLCSSCRDELIEILRKSKNLRNYKSIIEDFMSDADYYDGYYNSYEEVKELVREVFSKTFKD